MDCVLTLIAPEAGQLSPDMVNTARAALRSRHAETGRPEWLAKEEACDILFSAIDPSLADAAVRHVLQGYQLDCISQRTEHRRKMLLVADMDSTIITGETLDDLAAFAGVQDRITAITAKAMRGELDFEAALEERVAMLRGLPVSTLEQTWQAITLTPGARTLVQTMRAHGAYCLLASGGFTFFTERVARTCGFDEHQGNTLDLDGQALAGTVAYPILNQGTKLRLLMERAGARHIPLSATAAIGDGANDIPMLKAAGLGIAWRAKPLVHNSTAFRLDYCDLTGLLYAQGYRKDQIQENSNPGCEATLTDIA